MLGRNLRVIFQLGSSVDNTIRYERIMLHLLHRIIFAIHGCISINILLCGQPNRPHYASCASFRPSVRSVQISNSKKMYSRNSIDRRRNVIARKYMHQNRCERFRAHKQPVCQFAEKRLKVRRRTAARYVDTGQT